MFLTAKFLNFEFLALLLEFLEEFLNVLLRHDFSLVSERFQVRLQRFLHRVVALDRLHLFHSIHRPESLHALLVLRGATIVYGLWLIIVNCVLRIKQKCNLLVVIKLDAFVATAKLKSYEEVLGAVITINKGGEIILTTLDFCLFENEAIMRNVNP